MKTPLQISLPIAQLAQIIYDTTLTLLEATLNQFFILFNTYTVEVKDADVAPSLKAYLVLFFIY